MDYKKIQKEIIESDFTKEVKEIWNKSKLIVIISFIILLGLISIPLWDYIDGIITIGTLVAVVINIYINSKNNERNLQKIPIYFNDKKLNLDITRKDFSRQELQGILGILRKDMKVLYEIEYMSKIAYIDSIYKIQIGEEHQLIIKLEEKEWEQFRDDIFETNN